MRSFSHPIRLKCGASPYTPWGFYGFWEQPASAKLPKAGKATRHRSGQPVRRTPDHTRTAMTPRNPRRQFSPVKSAGSSVEGLSSIRRGKLPAPGLHTITSSIIKDGTDKTNDSSRETGKIKDETGKTTNSSLKNGKNKDETGKTRISEGNVYVKSLDIHGIFVYLHHSTPQ